MLEARFLFIALKEKVGVPQLCLPTWCSESKKFNFVTSNLPLANYVVMSHKNLTHACWQNTYFRGLTLAKAWNLLKKVHRRAQPNDGFAKALLALDRKLHGKVSMDWQHKRPEMKVCPICSKNVGLSTSSLKLHLQKAHKRLSAGSVDSAMTLEIQKSIQSLRISRGGSLSPSQKLTKAFADELSFWICS